MRYLPLFGITVFSLVGVCWRVWVHHRRYGSGGIFLFHSSDWRHNLRDGLALVLAVILVGEAVAWAIWPDILAARALIPPQNLLGTLLLFAGIALMVRAQLDLGASWRIGIEERAAPGLVSRGLYQFSRNPIFLAMLTALIGFTLLIPIWLSLVVLACSFFAIRRQTLDEEAYLLRTYPTDYRVYARRVGRFLPGIGRL